MNRGGSVGESDRRTFIKAAGLGGLLIVPASAGLPGKELGVPELVGGLRRGEEVAPLAGAVWYEGEKEGDGISIRFPAGALAGIEYLASDMLLDGNHLIVFSLALQEGEAGPTFRFGFGGLNQCSFRLRMPLALVDQNRWMIDREAAFLKPIAGGDRVDPKKVDRLTLTVRRKAPGAVRWCMTPIHSSSGEVPRLSAPLLTKGKLLDELGQSTLHEWPQKTRSADEVCRRIRGQYEKASSQVWPDTFTRWGGWKKKKIGEGTGFFRTHHDGRRWWFVDPDGHAFWSTGLDCVRVDAEARYDGLESALTWLPPANGEFREIYSQSIRPRGNGKMVNYIAANMIRSFGPKIWHQRWADIAMAEMRRLRFNTVGNWSEWECAQKASFPYARPMNFAGKRCGFVYRDFPDVFHPQFEADARDCAAPLAASAKDPAFLGYFLMNEPTWGFSSELPAVGMLYNTASCATRHELARFLKTRHGDAAKLSAAWGLPLTFERVASGKWDARMTEDAIADLRAFSVKMVERYFQVLSQSCKRVDPNHLNLGMRWAGVPPEWAVEGMKSFDVFSLNCYMKKLPRERAENIHQMLNMPVMVGEWHFGAHDVGLPASGIGHNPNQAQRAVAYRAYLEDAAANPYCVGVHWFTLYDQSALGRFDGENYNIGFLDICNRPYEEISGGAIASHERMYDVADGRTGAFSQEAQHLPLLFL